VIDTESTLEATPPLPQVDDVREVQVDSIDGMPTEFVIPLTLEQKCAVVARCFLADRPEDYDHDFEIALQDVKEEFSEEAINNFATWTLDPLRRHEGSKLLAGPTGHLINIQEFSGNVDFETNMTDAEKEQFVKDIEKSTMSFPYDSLFTLEDIIVKMGWVLVWKAEASLVTAEP